MNEKKQSIILVSLVLLFFLGTHLFHSQKLENKIAQLTIEVDSQQTHAVIKKVHERIFNPYKKEIIRIVRENHALVKAFAQGKRTQLYEAAVEDYKSLRKENSFFHVMHFHSPDSTTLLRMHKPDFFGDNLAGVRPIIDLVHKTQLPESGFEIGRHGLFYRIVQPVFLANQYIGALEFGIQAGQVLESIKKQTGEEVLPYYRASRWQEASHTVDGSFQQKGKYIVNTENNPLTQQLAPDFFSTDEDDVIITISGDNYQAHNHQIFTNFNNDIIGGIFVFQNVTHTIHKKRVLLWKYSAIALLIFLITIGTLYHFFDRIIGTLLTEITTRKSAEKVAATSEEQTRLLLNSTAEGIYGMDREGRCTFVNDSGLTILDHTKETLLGKNIHELIHHKRSDGSIFPFEECPMYHSYNNGEEVNIVDDVLWRKDGSPVHVDYHAFPIVKDGLLQGSVVTFIDISKRKKAEEEIRRLAAAIENSADEISITNLEGEIEYVNPSFERVTGYSKSEAIGQKMSLLKSNKHNGAFYRNLWETITAGQVWSNRIINKKKDGTLIEEDATISPIFDSKGQSLGYVSIKRDVTERMEMEERLRQSQKMEAIGTLAGGIAHDFNNILSGIMGFTSLSLLELPEESKIAGHLNEVMAAAEKAKDLVRHILSFSKKTIPEKSIVKVQAIVKEVTALSRSTLPSTITIKEKIDMEASPVWGDAAQIHQVIMNLITNAFQAMRLHGGLLEIDLKEENHPEVNPEGSCIVIRIADNGDGMDPETMAHIFEPYFTTKNQGEGTGLGLATVHGIIKSQGGDIRVESVPGQGSVFKLYLPTSTAKQTDKDKSHINKLDPSQLSPINGQILFVDDEPVNVALGEQILQLVGCKVTGMTNSRQALHLFKTEPDSFDLVITDQTMPDLTGFEMAQKMMAIKPDIPIIMVTGHSDIVDSEKAKKSGIRKFLMKPLVLQKLTEAVGRCLEHKDGL